MLETVRGAVRRLFKISNCAFQCSYYYDYDDDDDDDDDDYYYRCTFSGQIPFLSHELQECPRRPAV